VVDEVPKRKLENRLLSIATPMSPVMLPLLTRSKSTRSKKAETPEDSVPTIVALASLVIAMAASSSRSGKAGPPT